MTTIEQRREERRRKRMEELSKLYNDASSSSASSARHRATTEATEDEDRSSRRRGRRGTEDETKTEPEPEAEPEPEVDDSAARAEAEAEEERRRQEEAERAERARVEEEERRRAAARQEEQEELERQRQLEEEEERKRQCEEQDQDDLIGEQPEHVPDTNEAEVQESSYLPSNTYSHDDSVQPNESLNHSVESAPDDIEARSTTKNDISEPITQLHSDVPDDIEARSTTKNDISEPIAQLHGDFPNHADVFSKHSKWRKWETENLNAETASPPPLVSADCETKRHNIMKKLKEQTTSSATVDETSRWVKMRRGDTSNKPPDSKLISMSGGVLNFKAKFESKIQSQLDTPKSTPPNKKVIGSLNLKNLQNKFEKSDSSDASHGEKKNIPYKDSTTKIQSREGSSSEKTSRLKQKLGLEGETIADAQPLSPGKSAERTYSTPRYKSNEDKSETGSKLSSEKSSKDGLTSNDQVAEKAEKKDLLTDVKPLENNINEEEERQERERQERERRKEELAKKKEEEEQRKKGKRRGLGGLNPEKKKLLRDKDDDSNNKEQLQKERVLKERIQPLPDLDSLNSADLQKLCKDMHTKLAALEEAVYDNEMRIRKQDWEINELTLQVNDTKGKYIKPVLRKINKTEAKTSKFDKKDREDFRSNLKSTGQNKYTLDDESVRQTTKDA